MAPGQVHWPQPHRMHNAHCIDTHTGYANVDMAEACAPVQPGKVQPRIKCQLGQVQEQIHSTEEKDSRYMSHVFTFVIVTGMFLKEEEREEGGRKKWVSKHEWQQVAGTQ